MDYFLQAVFPLSSFLFSLFEQSNYLQQCYRSSDQGAEVQTFFCQFCRPLKSYRLHHTLKSSPPLPVSDLHLPSVHPHVLLRSLSLCFAFVSSLSFSFHSSLSLGGDLDPRGPCGSADGLGSTQGRRKRRKVSLVGGKNNDVDDDLCPAALLWCPNLSWTLGTKELEPAHVERCEETDWLCFEYNECLTRMLMKTGVIIQVKNSPIFIPTHEICRSRPCAFPLNFIMLITWRKGYEGSDNTRKSCRKSSHLCLKTI